MSADRPVREGIRTERTEARLLPEQKRRIELAASLKGVSISDFIVQNADEAAIRTIEQFESWRLTDKDRDVFVQALLHLPRPGARLRSAAKRFPGTHEGLNERGARESASGRGARETA